MKIKRLLVAMISILIAFSNNYANSAELQCPQPWQIVPVLLTPNSVPYWFAPKMPTSREGGIGLGTLKKAPFQRAEETELEGGKPGWVCYYWSTEVAPLSELIKKKNELPPKAKELLSYVKYPGAGGVVVYVKK